MIIKKRFRTNWFLRNRHAQTVYPLFFNKQGNPNGIWQTLELPDGDFVDVVWFGKDFDDPGNPLILMLHGLGGCVESHYARNTIHALRNRGFNVLFMHTRGCSGKPNRLDRTFHGGDTSELQQLLQTLAPKNVPLGAIGFSMGANILLKFLGEQGGRPENNHESKAIRYAMGVSPPFSLGQTADYLQSGSSRLYQSYLLRRLKQLSRAKLHAGADLGISAAALNRIKTLRAFDELITARSNGFAGADDYYRHSSCTSYLRSVATPTLVVHALDDPFIPASAIPREQQLSEHIQLELYDRGGHVGFTRNRHNFLSQRCLDYFVNAFGCR